MKNIKKSKISKNSIREILEKYAKHIEQTNKFAKFKSVPKFISSDDFDKLEEELGKYIIHLMYQVEEGVRIKKSIKDPEWRVDKCEMCGCTSYTLIETDKMWIPDEK